MEITTESFFEQEHVTFAKSKKDRLTRIQREWECV